MDQPTDHNPLGRFSGLAATYGSSRPGYPPGAIDLIVGGLPEKGRVADVGCGTGILSRPLAERGVGVIGVEPNDEMRAGAEATRCDAPTPPRYQAGQAERTGLAAESVDVVVAAQAFHWFDADAALREFHRILRPGGRVVLLWNEADTSDPFSGAFWRALTEAATDPEVVRRPFHVTGRPILTHPLFAEAREVSFPNEQQLDEAGLLARAASASFAPKEGPALEALTRRLRDLFSGHQRGGAATLRYRTTGFVARRNG
jgi:SAM-dependent methyltransferase